MHAITQRPMAMYHSWGSQNAWLRQIHGANWLYMSRTRAARSASPTTTGCGSTSRIGRVKAQVKLMEGVNPTRCGPGTRSASAPAPGRLAPDAPESTHGFLLNHLIAELLPEQAGGYRYSNSDPVTGQAAWYDLQVRIEKAVSATRLPRPRRASSRLWRRPASALPLPEWGRGSG